MWRLFAVSVTLAIELLHVGALSAQTSERFETLMKSILIVDAHVDTPGYIVDEGYQLAEEHRYYEVDLPRMRAWPRRGRLFWRLRAAAGLCAAPVATARYGMDRRTPR